jgi:hypothetical protein
LGADLIPEIDIWRAANLLIRKHGANAELEAAECADLMLDCGDDDGRLLWMRIRRAIEALQAVPRGRLNFKRLLDCGVPSRSPVPFRVVDGAGTANRGNIQR